MFRALRPRIGILGLARLPLRVRSQALQDPSMVVQRVRMGKPPIRPRAILIKVLGVIIVTSVFQRVVLAPIEKAADELDEALDEKTKKELLEDSNNNIFIPFPFTLKQVIPPPYRATDSEWREFIKLSKNQELKKRIQDDLAQHVTTRVNAASNLTMQWGKDIKLRKYWLDIDYPMGPPPEFVRTGIEISDTSISVTTAPINSLAARRIQQAFYPVAAAKATWSWLRVLFTLQHPGQAAKQILIEEIASKQGRSYHSPKPTTFAELKSEPSRKLNPEQPTKPRGAPTTSSASGPLTIEPIKQRKELHGGIENQIKDLQKANGQVEESITNEYLQKINKFSEKLQYRYLAAGLAFKAKLFSEWRPAPIDPPRGCIFVSGLVELDSPKAWFVIDVMAPWDPKTREFDPRQISTKLRRVQPKQQRPLG